MEESKNQIECAKKTGIFHKYKEIFDNTDEGQ